MSRPYHIPVLVEPVVAFFAAVPPGPIVDATLGGGGHAEALARATGPDRTIIGVDRDPAALEAARERLLEGRSFPGRFIFTQGDFGDLEAVLERAGVSVGHALSGLLLDLGVSSRQLDEPGRGFGLKHEDAPLDMRMDPSSGGPTALDLVRSLDDAGLARVLGEYGEVRRPGRLARAMKETAAEGRLETTGDLARLVERVLPAGRDARAGRGDRTRRVHPATVVFQALRIAVNDELGALDRVLGAAPGLLAPGGRLAVISYHSLEDRRVKDAFRLGSEGPPRPGKLPPPSGWVPAWEVLTKKPVRPSDGEVASNPRARSARLRVAARAPIAPEPGGHASGGRS